MQLARIVRTNLVILFSGICAVAQQPPAAELDIGYGKDSALQVVDLYVPATKGFTTVVYTYGGGWHSGSGKRATAIAEKLRELGYGCVLVSHRLFPPSTFPAQGEDLAAAFAWVKANIAARGGDPKRLVLAGHSSGAHLSLLLATDPRFLAARNLARADISAVVGLSTPVDLTRHADGRGYGDVLLSGNGASVFGRDEALMRNASPIEHVSRGLPPTLLVVGENDFPMLEGDARAFARKAESVGASVQLVVAPGKDHMGVARGMSDDNDAVLAPATAFPLLRLIISVRHLAYPRPRHLHGPFANPRPAHSAPVLQIRDRTAARTISFGQRHKANPSGVFHPGGGIDRDFVLSQTSGAMTLIAGHAGRPGRRATDAPARGDSPDNIRHVVGLGRIRDEQFPIFKAGPDHERVWFRRAMSCQARHEASARSGQIAVL